MDDSPAVQGPDLPRAVLDAGGEVWATLSAAVGRLIDEIASGAVLEIISLEPGTRAAIEGWCGASGHTLLPTDADDAATRFWIRKGGGVTRQGGIELE